MNLKGSYLRLRNNSIAAMLAAIEIYNKPQISYRDECFIILLMNAWELLFKSILSKNGQRIYYSKKRNEPYRTFSLSDSMKYSRDFFPNNILYEPVSENISLLNDYRNNTIHFYNQSNFSIIIFGLSQTNIVNYRDILYSIFRYDISNDINISLLPLSFGTQPDPIVFINKNNKVKINNRLVADYIKSISIKTYELVSKNIDTSRFLSKFSYKLESVKKISTSDVIVGIDSNNNNNVILERLTNPNLSHPLSRVIIIEKMKQYFKMDINRFTFDAIIWKYNIKNNQRFYFQADNGGRAKYSHEFLSFIKALKEKEIESIVNEYKDIRFKLNKPPTG